MLIEDVPGQLVKETADKRARNGDLIEQLSAWFEGRTSVSVIDLRAGTGATVRALAPILPSDQTWTLLALSQDEADATRDHLTRWAPAATSTGDILHLDRQGLKLAVTIKVLDAVAKIPAALSGKADLVTLSGDASRYPAAKIRELVAHVAAKKAPFYASLNYDGRLKFAPHHAADSAMTAALHRTLMADTGLGPAAGPLASNELSEQFRLTDYSVLEGPSAVWLRAGEAALIRQIQRSMAEAQRLTVRGQDKMIDAWLARPRQSLEISQSDLLALPS